MLSENTVALLSSLTYRPDAERMCSLTDLGGIFWQDELPKDARLYDLLEQERLSVYRLFLIRYRLWYGKVLSAEERCFWDAARKQVPEYALFRRLTVSADDMEAQREAEVISNDFLRVLSEEADEIEITGVESGIEMVSARFDLTKDQEPRKSWRARLPWRIWRRK